MTIPERTTQDWPIPKLDFVEALRNVNKWEASNTTAKIIRVKVFRNYSAEFIEPFLKHYFATRGMRCEIDFGGFDAFQQEIIEASDLNSYNLILLSLTGDALIDGRHRGSSPEEAIAKISGLIEHIETKTAASVVLNTLIRPLLDEGGASFSLQPTSQTHRVDSYNRQLRTFVTKKSPRCALVDWERIVMLTGVEAAFDRRLAYTASAPFRHAFLNLYAREIHRIEGALSGRTKKCLVLDCDNTLWGGIVGEVGVEGIDLDPNEYPGKAYYDFQRAVLRLADQGIMIALCSKNNPEDVESILDNHPHCLIKRSHLVASRVNWRDKEVNLRELVEDLNIGFDAVVFVDDNPMECARIQALLTDVTVRQVPERLHDLPVLLDQEGLFDKIGVTKEDFARTAMYQKEEQRREAAKLFSTAEEFLASLEIRASIRMAKDHELSRVAQLTQKTNQFNLTTRKYSEAEIRDLAGREDCAVYALSARDRFGDLGLTGVLIAKRADATAVIDTLLMSCRVLGRRLELQFVTECLRQLIERWRVGRWEAEYVRTEKNRQVVNFWDQFGFEPVAKDPDRILYQARTASLTLHPTSFVALEPA
jgi:FkbH-like protein